MSWKAKSFILVLAALGLLIAGLIQISKSEPTVTTQSNSVRILESFWPKYHVDPKSLRTAGDWVGLQNLFSNLVEIKGSLDVRPDLAESWLRSPDGLTWTFQLRFGIKWSDGTPMTSGQIAASLMRAFDGTTHTNLKSYVKSISAKNDGEIEFKLHRVPENFLVMLSYVDLAIVHPSASTKNGFSWSAPTSGPYRAKIISDTEMTLVANEHHWSFSPATIRQFSLIRARGDQRDVDALLGSPYDACHIGAGIADEKSVQALSKVYSVLTGDSDFLMSLFFSSARVKEGKWPEELRRSVLKETYREFWASDPDNSLRATGLRPAGTRGSLSFGEFDDVLGTIVSKEAPLAGMTISVLVQEKHSQRVSFLKVIDILKRLGAKVDVISLDRDAYHSRYDKRDFDLAFQLLGASEGDPDSAWRIYSDDFAMPVATEAELDRAQLEKRPEVRGGLYKSFERKAIERALYIPLKNEVTYIVTSQRVRIDTDTSSDWGIKLSKLRMK